MNGTTELYRKKLGEVFIGIFKPISYEIVITNWNGPWQLRMYKEEFQALVQELQELADSMTDVPDPDLYTTLEGD